MSAPPVLMVDRNDRNLELLAEFVESEGYRPVAVTGLEEAREEVDGDALSAALVDIAGFDDSVWKLCEDLRSAAVPFVVISPEESREVRRQSRESGARDVQVKPLVPDRLRLLLRGLAEG